MAAHGNIPIPGSSGALSAAGALGTGSGGGTCAYMGITVRETAGAAAVVRIREGTFSNAGVVASTGRILDTIALAANASLSEWYGPQGKFCNGDIYYEKVSGAVEGAVFYA